MKITKSDVEMRKLGCIKEGDNWILPKGIKSQQLTEARTGVAQVELDEARRRKDRDIAKAAAEARKLKDTQNTPAAVNERLIESFMSMGMSKEAAEVAVSNRGNHG